MALFCMHGFKTFINMIVLYPQLHNHYKYRCFCMHGFKILVSISVLHPQLQDHCKYYCFCMHLFRIIVHICVCLISNLKVVINTFVFASKTSKSMHIDVLHPLLQDHCEDSVFWIHAIKITINVGCFCTHGLQMATNVIVLHPRLQTHYEYYYFCIHGFKYM